MATKQAKTLYIIGGGKGGVGKSMLTMALLDYLLSEAKNERVTLVETDPANPDVYKSYEKVKSVGHKLIALDSEQGWINLLNDLPELIKDPVIVNTAAGASAALMQHMPMLFDAQKELGFDLRMFWPINRQRDSLVLLNEVLNAMPNIHTTVVRNTYFGGADKFVLFDESKVKDRVQQVMDLPELNDRVTDQLINKRLPLDSGNELAFGDRIALQRFRAACAEALKAAGV